MAPAEFDRAANDSPRSGSTRKSAPVIWCMIVAAMLGLAIYFAMKFQ
jgi:hypothetical protein